MGKFIKFLICIFVFSLSFSLISCNKNKTEVGKEEKTEEKSEEKDHECQYSAWGVVSEGDCYKKGLEERFCVICGAIENRETDFVHYFETIPAREPDCVYYGHNEYQKCSRCYKEVGYEEIPALGHKDFYYESINESYHYKYCGICNEKVDSFENHELNDGVTLDPTCTEGGSFTQSCKLCDHEYHEIYAALGHTYGDEATCTTDQVCTVCNEVLVEATGHIAAAGSCDEDSVCAICNIKLEDAKGHVSSGDATCTEAEYCQTCNEVITYPSHSFVDGVCSVCADLEPTEGLIYSLEFDNELYYAVTGIKDSTSYVVIPNTYNGLPVKEICDSAFEYDSLLEKVLIPESVKYVGENAFSGCVKYVDIFVCSNSNPQYVGPNWSGAANVYYNGEFELVGNVATSTLEDNEANGAYDIYLKALSSVDYNYSLFFEHDFSYSVSGVSMDFVGSIDYKTNGTSIYAHEKLVSSQSMAGSSESLTTETKEYYNDGYLYSHVIKIDNQTYHTKQYCTLPMSQFMSDSTTIDVVTPTRSDFSKAVFTSYPDGLRRIVLSTSNGYTAEELGKFINFDKMALNMDISGILLMPNAHVEVLYTYNEITKEFTLNLTMSGSMDGYNMSYNSSSVYSEVGTTQNQVCPEKEEYTLHQHTPSADLATTCEEVVCKNPSCKKIIQEAKEHTFDSFSCESNKCIVCGEVVLNNNKHLYNKGECIYCGVRQGTKNLEFELVNNEYYILTDVSLSGTKDIVIPTQYNGLPVKGVSEEAFDGYNVNSIYLPSSLDYNETFIKVDNLETLILENIDDMYPLHYYFYDTLNVNEIIIKNGTSIPESYFSNSTVNKFVLPETLTKISDRAFYKCEYLTEINIPDSVTTIGESAFALCSSLESITLPSELKVISSNLFDDCKKLAEVNLPSNLEKIRNYAFNNCTSLRELVIPISVIEIDEDAFNGCSSIETLTIPGGVMYNWLFTDAQTTLTTVYVTGQVLNHHAFTYMETLRDVTFVDELTEIGYNAFERCTSLQMITIPNTVLSIGYETFKDCYALSAVIFEEESQVRSIGEKAFENCSNLTIITLPDGLEEIGNGILNGTGIKHINLPASLTNVPNAVFGGCESLESVITYNDKILISDLNIHNLKEVEFKTTVIKNYSLYGCTNLEKAIINETVTEIGDMAFYGCEKLKELYIAHGVETIGSGAFGACTSLETITLPASITKFGGYAFEVCEKLETVYFKGTLNDWFKIEDLNNGSPLVNASTLIVTTLYGETINTNGIEELVLEEGVEIGFRSLATLTGLQKLTLAKLDHHLGYYFGAETASENNQYIPETLKEVTVLGGTTFGHSAFYNCSNLTKITLPFTAATMDVNFLKGCNSLEELTIPYIGDSYRYSNYSFLGYVFGTYSFSDQASYVPETLKEVTVLGHKELGSHAFYGLSNITKIHLPDTLEGVGEYAFYGCHGLETIEIPTGVTSIGSHAFENCDSLMGITLPNTLTRIGDSIAEGSELLETVYFTGSMDDWCNIEFNYYTGNPMNYASYFYYLNGSEYQELFELELSNEVTKVHEYQFYNFQSIRNVSIPDSVTEIGVNAFSGCSSIETMTLPFIGTSVDSGYEFVSIFGGGSNNVPDTLHKIVITGGTIMTSNAFAYLRNIQTVVLPESLVTLGEYAFSNCTSLKNITLPKNLKSIGQQAFTGCNNIENIYYTGTIDDWCKLDFSTAGTTPTLNGVDLYVYQDVDVQLLTDVVISEGVTSLGKNQFVGVESIQYISLPKSLTSIGEDAFKDCSNLRYVNYSGEIGDWANISFASMYSNPMYYGTAFYLIGGNDPEFVTSITIHQGVSSINQYAFYSFDALEEVTILNPDIIINANVFNECNSLTKMKVPFIGRSKDDTKYDILSYFFGGTSNSQNATKVPYSLTEIELTHATQIGASTFWQCANLINIIIPDTVESIGDSAFAHCTTLESIIIPAKVTEIKANAFNGCSGLRNVYCYAEAKPEGWSSSWLGDCNLTPSWGYTGK